MVKPINPLPTPPLSPGERGDLNDRDRDVIDAWQFRLKGMPPCEHDLQRLFVLGKRAGRCNP